MSDLGPKGLGIDKSFLGNARYPYRALRRRTTTNTFPGWEFRDRSTSTTPFTFHSPPGGMETNTIFDVNNGWFWNRVRVENGKVVPRFDDFDAGGVSQDFIDGVLRLGNVGSGLLIQKRRQRTEAVTNWTDAHMRNRLGGTGTSTRYIGPVGITGIFRGDVPAFVPHVHSSDAQLNTAGTFAISQTIPTSPASNLGVALAELREGLPSIPGRDFSRNPSMAAAGSEYLNYQFGIAPTVTDAKEIAKAIRNSRKIMEQFIRDSEKLVRRRYNWPTERVTTTYENVRFKTGSSVSNASQLVGTVSETVTTDRWFVGAYRYELPGGSSALERLKLFEAKANKLLGLRLTPDMLWQLSPWSWFVDWFVNVGDVLNNVSLFMRDGLVLQYGYIMETKSSERTAVSNDSRTCSSAVFKDTYLTKRRLPASPFGFGVDFDSLSDYQWSILIALGMTKTKTKPPQI